MSTWDDLLAVTHPGTEVEAGTDRWLVMRRSYTPGTAPTFDNRDDTLTLTVELVRSGSSADPREIPPPRFFPSATPSREDTAP